VLSDDNRDPNNVFLKKRKKKKIVIKKKKKIMDIYYLIVDDVMGFSNIRCIYFGYLYRSKEDKYSYYIERLGSFNPTDMSEVYINILRYWY